MRASDTASYQIEPADLEAIEKASTALNRAITKLKAKVKNGPH